MKYKSIIFYCLSLCSIFMAIITIAYQVGKGKHLDRPVMMFPDITDFQNSINKININFPDEAITLKRVDNIWRITSSDDFPADPKTIEKLYTNIASIKLLTKKTQISENFSRLKLINPSLSQKIRGEGTRITLSSDKEKTLIDFISGIPLKSYKNIHNKRIFVRYGTVGGALLAQADANFNLKKEDFFSKNFGMPKFNEVINAKVVIEDRVILEMHRTVDTFEKNKIIFLPPQIPYNKKLIYPFILTEYMAALTQKFKPSDAIQLPPEKIISDVSIKFNLTKGRLAKINFWRSEKNFFMRVIRNDMNAPYNFYIYRITKKDYNTFIQPLDSFLSDAL